MVDTLQTCTRGVQGAVILAEVWESFNYASFDFLYGILGLFTP